MRELRCAAIVKPAILLQLADAAYCTLQLVRRLNQFLFDSCASFLGNQTALNALYDFKADIFIGDALTACAWISSDVLG